MCPNCNHEMFIDHVDSEGRYVYKCMNQRCPNYRKAMYLDGTTAEPTIKAKAE